MSKQKDKTLNKRGLLKNKSDFAELLNQYPTAPFFMRLNNFNEIKQVNAVGIFIESESEDGRAYLRETDITPYLPEDILKKIKEPWISVSAFKNLSQELANTMKREVVIIHQRGSGRQEDASFQTYRYPPQRLMSRRDFLRKILHLPLKQ